MEQTFYFGLHLIRLPEKNRDRGLSFPMLKIGLNWGKIANYPPPNAQQRFAPLVPWHSPQTLKMKHDKAKSSSSKGMYVITA